ncbi:hypothetical protein [Psychrobacter piscatorii]|uniref:hypothetical protein n=1 Tax=Psychrobacter piscatorii TaxID=554343 RepID=UPI0037366D6B
MNQNATSINFSRAGDIFHYRWAVKRCLKLLDFDTDLTHITIEGSDDYSQGGENVVDLAEYRKSANGENSVEYFQLKHSTVRADEDFKISDLKDTIIGFSQRYVDSVNSNHFKSYKFTVTTNRKICPNFKKNISSLAHGIPADKAFVNTIKRYTKLSETELKDFCSHLNLHDIEGNFNVQKQDIHKELSRIWISKNVTDMERLLVATVWERLEPNKRNTVKKEDILEAFNITDINDFFPAPPKFEALPNNYVPRQQQDAIINSIQSTNAHTIITASGGVGKSILSSNLVNILPMPNIVIAYDCFGNGGYRKTSEKRHTVKDAMTQVINELAKAGYCLQIIPTRNEPDEHWIRQFLDRINEVCSNLTADHPQALLVIVFDAVDNAMMAADEFNESCFANQLLKEDVPDNCRLVFTCRPERLELLDPPSSIVPLELSPFTIEETLKNLQQHYADVNIAQAEEFNSLTGGNPRVQANALALNYKSLHELLLSFNSTTITVEDLIERQLAKAINELKDDFPLVYRQDIDSICIGLATLPPFIPLSVLATIALVPVDLVKSFVADLGRPLWLTDHAVQFRDEPTEKWFQDTFTATNDQISSYIDAIKQLDTISPYIAEALPILLHKSEKYNKLVALALSDKYLPEGSPYDKSLIKIIRLQYAFKASLKVNRIHDATKLALLAGEEIASNERQNEVFKNNIDLVTQNLSEGRITELAHKKVIRGKWQGSELVYSASLLASLPDSKGQATVYLRSAEHFLHRYFKKRDENDEEKNGFFNEKLEDIDIVELASAHFNIFGSKDSVDFIVGWKPPETMYRIGLRFLKRLIDRGDIATVAQMAIYGKDNPSFVLAATEVLMQVGIAPPRECLTRCLNIVINPKARLVASSEYSGYRASYSNHTFLSFFEACLIEKLPIKDIRRGLNYYYNKPYSYALSEIRPNADDVENFLRFLSLQSSFKDKFKIDPKNFIKQCFQREGQKSYEAQKEFEDSCNLIDEFLPLYILRIKAFSDVNIISSDDLNKNREVFVKSHSSHYQDYDPKAYLATKAKFEIILFGQSDLFIDIFIEQLMTDVIKRSLQNDFCFLSASCQHHKLEELVDFFESDLNKLLNKFDIKELPETYSDSYISFARAVLAIDTEAASVYFDTGLKKATNFGNEVAHRWEAISAIAQRSVEDKLYSPQLAHRYMRVAELIGDSDTGQNYWDERQIFSTCLKISPLTTLAIANRWKERNVGWHGISNLVGGILDIKEINPIILWAFTAFSFDSSLVGFFDKIVAITYDKQNQQTMLDHVIRALRVKGCTGRDWKTIENIASQYNLSNNELNNLERLIGTDEKSDSKIVPIVNLAKKKDNSEKNQSWLKRYGHVDILTKNGFREAFNIFKDNRRSRQYDDYFWQGCFEQVSSRKSLVFLDIVVNSEELSFHGIRDAFEAIPEQWKTRPALLSHWSVLISHLASRFPINFTHNNRYEQNFLGSFIINEASREVIRLGATKGLSETGLVEDAGSLFQFARYYASQLTVAEAKDLVDFGLCRFEKYVDSEYADGVWKDEFLLPTSIAHAIISYIYANLGSPFVEERWRAVHAVVRLYQLECYEEIDLLMDCLSNSVLDIFIPPAYEFYALHAKLYLLAALTRCVHISATPLLKHKEEFVAIALDDSQGILFQYYAKQICLQIYGSIPNSFDESTFNRINQIAVSQISAISGEEYGYSTDSPWHQNQNFNDLPEFYFGYDFDKSWLPPLGRVFGISAKQVEDIAKDILFNEWGMVIDGKWINDSRKNLWKKLNSHSRQYDMHGRDGSYPDIDSYSFYISYHLMLAVASRLVKTMPVVQVSYHEKSSWLEWLDRHLLLDDNLKLLSESRDYIPIERRDWVIEDDIKEWQWQIKENDFIDLLVSTQGNSTWLNVEGEWEEVEHNRIERVSFKSILVSKCFSQSLLNTTINHENYVHECFLYDFCLIDDEHDDKMFTAVKLLELDEQRYGVGSMDPFLGGVRRMQPFKLHSSIKEVIHCTYSDDMKDWQLDDRACLQSRYWSEDKPSHNDDYMRNGNQALASLDLLTLVCKQMNVEIAIQVNIKRTYKDSYNSRSKDDDIGYIPPYSKTFLLSADGKLRDATKRYQLR